MIACLKGFKPLELTFLAHCRLLFLEARAFLEGRDMEGKHEWHAEE